MHHHLVVGPEALDTSAARLASRLQNPSVPVPVDVVLRVLLPQLLEQVHAEPHVRVAVAVWVHYCGGSWLLLCFFAVLFAIVFFLLFLLAIVFLVFLLLFSKLSLGLLDAFLLACGLSLLLGRGASTAEQRLLELLS